MCSSSPLLHENLFLNWSLVYYATRSLNSALSSPQKGKKRMSKSVSVSFSVASLLFVLIACAMHSVVVVNASKEYCMTSYAELLCTTAPRLPNGKYDYNVRTLVGCPTVGLGCWLSLQLTLFVVLWIGVFVCCCLVAVTKSEQTVGYRISKHHNCSTNAILSTSRGMQRPSSSVVFFSSCR